MLSDKTEKCYHKLETTNSFPSS